MSGEQLPLFFKHYRPDSGSHRTIDTATGTDLNEIAESFGLRRHCVDLGMETDLSLRDRVRRVLDGYYEDIGKNQ